MRKLLIILTCIIAFSCEERIEDSINAQNTDLIVVEGVLTNELKNHRVRLTRPYATQNADENPISNALVVIVDSDENFTVLREFPRGSGNYYTDSLIAVFGKAYLLYIKIGDVEYTGFDASPVGQPLGPLPLIENLEDDPVSYSIEPLEVGTVPNYIIYNISWFTSPQCVSDCFGQVIHYDLKTIDVQETYAPEKEVFKFPVGSRIVRRKFNVSSRYQEYLRSLLSETEWRGGVFDVEKANVKTNMSEGAIGFFAVTTVVSDTITIIN